MMRSRLLHDVSQHLALLLERGIAGGEEAAEGPREPSSGPSRPPSTRPTTGTPGGGERRVPVFLCHPLDPFEEEETLKGRTVGILYPLAIAPERALRQPGLALVRPRSGGAAERLRREPLWIRLRYVFLVAGGPLEDQLGTVEAALRTLHDTPMITPAAQDGGSDADAAGEPVSFPLRIVDDPDGWRELGLTEHRLLINFEVTIPIESARFEPVERVLERDLRIEGSAG